MSLGPGGPCEYGLLVREQADRCDGPAAGDTLGKARQQVGMWRSQQRKEHVHLHGGVSVDTHVDACEWCVWPCKTHGQAWGRRGTMVKGAREQTPHSPSDFSAGLQRSHQRSSQGEQSSPPVSTWSISGWQVAAPDAATLPLRCRHVLLHLRLIALKCLLGLSHWKSQHFL